MIYVHSKITNKPTLFQTSYCLSDGSSLGAGAPWCLSREETWWWGTVVQGASGEELFTEHQSVQMEGQHYDLGEHAGVTCGVNSSLRLVQHALPLHWTKGEGCKVMGERGLLLAPTGLVGEEKGSWVWLWCSRCEHLWHLCLNL